MEISPAELLLMQTLAENRIPEDLMQLVCSALETEEQRLIMRGYLEYKMEQGIKIEEQLVLKALLVLTEPKE